jgi:hypothetical protein
MEPDKQDASNAGSIPRGEINKNPAICEGIGQMVAGFGCNKKTIATK